MNSEGFHELAARARDGDREAMDRVLDRLRPYIQHVARTYADPARPAASTMDLVQDSCLRAWNSIGSFRGGETDEETFNTFRVWIGRILRGLGVNAIEALKAKKRDPGGPVLRLEGAGSDTSTGAGGSGSPTDRSGRIDPPARGSSPSSIIGGRERAERVRQALARHPDELGATIVRMHFFEGLRISEIAQKLETPYDSVRDRFRAVKRALRVELRDIL